MPRSIDDPIPSHEVNINGTFNVLRAAHEGQGGPRSVRRLVVRLRRQRSAAQSGDMPARPKSPYALQKLVGEYYCNVFTGVYGLETVALRYFNVYGPRQDPSSQYSGVLSLFIRAILERRPPTIFGDGSQSRDFTYVEDVAELNLKAARATNVAGRMYNAGNGGRITLNEAWALLQKIEGVEIPPQYGPPARRRCPGLPGGHRVGRSENWATLRAFPLKRACGRTLDWYRTSGSHDRRYLR